MGVREGMGTGKTMQIEQSLESVKRGSVDHFHREFIPRDGKSHRECCFPPEKAKTAVAQLEVVSSKMSLRWCLEKLRLWQVKATMEDVVGQNEVSAKAATFERKDI